MKNSELDKRLKEIQNMLSVAESTYDAITRLREDLYAEGMGDCESCKMEFHALELVGEEKLLCVACSELPKDTP